MEGVDSGAAGLDATDEGTVTELPGHTIERMVTRDVTGEAAENLRIEQKSMVKKYSENFLEGPQNENRRGNPA